MKFFGFLAALVLAVIGGFYLLQPQECGADCLGAQSKLITVSPADFKSKLAQKDATIIDVRTPEEYVTGHLAGALNINFNDTDNFSTYLDTLEKNREYLIYCRSGNRSGQALKIMKDKGFTNITDLEGGITAWNSIGYPIEK